MNRESVDMKEVVRKKEMNSESVDMKEVVRKRERERESVCKYVSE